MYTFSRVLSCLLALCLLLGGFSVGQLFVSAVELTGYQNESVVRFKNAGSGKYLNVHYGQDADKVNVYQWTADGSVEQTFRLRYNVEEDCYLIGAMCSSNGAGRVLDIVKSGGQPANGSNVQIYNATDPVAQQWQFEYQGDGKFTIFPTADIYLVLTANGNSNGSGTGKSATSAGNVYLSEIAMSSDVDYSPHQLWYIEEVNPQQVLSNGTYRIANDNGRFMTLDVDDDYNVCQTGDPGQLASSERKKSQWRAQQLWHVEYLHSGNYLISPYIDSARKLAAFGDYESLSANVCVTSDDIQEGSWSQRQQWKIIPNADDAYRIVSKGDYNTQAVTVHQGDTDDFTNIQMVPFYNAPSQRWNFNSASTVCSGSSVGGHIVEYTGSGYFCVICWRRFLSPQEQDYTNANMSDEELALIFALQRMAKLKLIEGDKDHFVQACYKATDIIRSMRDDNNAYDFRSGNGSYISPVKYTYSASSMDASITFEVTTYGERYAAGRGVLYKINSGLPFPFSAISNLLWMYADPIKEYSFSEWLEFTGETIVDGLLAAGEHYSTGLAKEVFQATSGTRTLHSVYTGGTGSSNSFIQVVIEVADKGSKDRFIGMYDVGANNTVYVYKEEHLITERDWNDAPENLLDGVYIADNGGTFYVYEDLF